MIKVNKGEDMADKNKQNSWESRNKAIKIYKSTGNFGWMHLIIGENKETKRRFLRLKRYMNWFSIPDPTYLQDVQEMLKVGSKELEWGYDESREVKIEEVKDGEKTIAIKEKASKSIPGEIIDFIKDYPEFTEKLISLNIENQNTEYLIDLLAMIDSAVSKSGERFKVAFKEVIEKISKQDSKGIQELSDLMEKWNLFQITALTKIIKNRLDTIGTFEQLIHDNNTYEIKTDNSIHRILENNMWLIDDNYWIVQTNKSLRRFIGDEILKKDKKYAKKDLTSLVSITKTS